MEATAEVSKTFHEKIRKHTDMVLLSCAYAGTGNVLKVILDVNQFSYEIRYLHCVYEVADFVSCRSNIF